MAVLVALMSMLLMSALGAALVLTTTAETAIAAHFRDAQVAVYSADAALELAIAEIATQLDWTPLLDGSFQSALAREPPAGAWTLGDGSSLDLNRLINRLNCRNASGCTASSLVALTPQRPWGANNPVWQLYAYGPLATFLSGQPDPSGGASDASQYVVVLLADDPSENDGDPRRDGSDAANAGSGVVVVRGESFGPRGSHQVVEATIARTTRDTTSNGVQVWSWRLLQ
jgi:hypothetical protein